MELRRLSIFMIALLVIQACLSFAFVAGSYAQASPDVYVGIDLSYGDVAEAKAMIDQVSSFTNLFVVGTSKITWNPDKLTEIFQHAYDKGLSFMSLTPSIPLISIPEYSSLNQSEWFKYAKENWGDRLLGFYQDDEPGGKTLDKVRSLIANSSTVINSYTEAADQFVNLRSRDLNHVRTQNLGSSSYPLLTSDYALYWFDYKSGYDAIFAELGWNYSRQINIALCRGAATVQNKEWGAIVTWTYTVPPYIESGEDLYNDLILAYDNGAKYIVVYDGNEGWTGGILQQEHLDALQRFWDYIQSNPRKNNPVSERTAYVLPEAYGYGFRGPSDHIWGLWEADDDERTLNITISVASLLDYYGEQLDIIYDDGLESGNNYGYNQLVYWDSYSPPPPKISILSPENKTYAENNVSLAFKLSKPVTWIGYSLDNQSQVTITENTTLTNLPAGPHNITVYAKDEFEAIGASETIHFNIDPPKPFPIMVVAIATTTSAALVAAGLLFYLRKRKR
jgi:hypothetical protein